LIWQFSRNFSKKGYFMKTTLTESIISRVDIWEGKKVEYEILSGGLSNHNYTCVVDNEKYVLRVPGEGTEVFIDRGNEQGAILATAQIGVSPEVLCIVNPENAMVLPFVEGKVMNPGLIAADDEIIAKIVNVLKNVHAEADFQETTYVFDMIRKYTKWARERNAFFPDDFDWMCQIVDKIEKAMERDKPNLAACHNDVLSENFILDKSGKMWLLDWEYCGMNDPFFDLGDFAVEHPLSRRQEESIMLTYCGERQPHRLYRILLHKLTADLWWSLWAMIQNEISNLDFDYYRYGLGRYARFRENYYDPDFKTWLEGV
jgi:thiamine kinase-like enzyme